MDDGFNFQLPINQQALEQFIARKVVDSKAAANCDLTAKIGPLSQNRSEWFVLLILNEEED